MLPSFEFTIKAWQLSLHTADARTPPTEGLSVSERLIERRTDTATGIVTERVLQTVSTTPGAAETTGGVATNDSSAIPPAPAFAPPSPTDSHAPPGDSDEVYYEGSPMLRGEFGRVAVSGLVALGLFMIPVAAARLSSHGLPRWWHWWLSMLFILAGLVVLVIPFVLTKSIRYQVTNYRISRERGAFSRDIDTLELWHVEDLAFRQSFYRRLMGVGTIHILSHDRENPNLVLESVPDARKLFSTLQQRVIAVKRTGGVVKTPVDDGRGVKEGRPIPAADRSHQVSGKIPFVAPVCSRVYRGP